MLTLMMTVKLWEIVDLNVVRNSRSQRAKTSRSVAIVIARFKGLDVVVLEPFFQRKVIKFSA